VPVVARIAGAPVAVTSTAVASLVVRRYMDQCSTLDPSCWQWHTFDVPVAVVEVAPATPFPEGADVALGADAVDRVIVHIGPAGACPERRPLAEEMCADPLGGACTGGAFTCDNGDGGLLCDGGVPGDHDGGAVLDAPAAHDHGDDGGCTTGGGGPGAAELGAAGLALVALAPRRRRR
jgi:MYXO-CTERM domain-containing protein